MESKHSYINFEGISKKNGSMFFISKIVTLFSVRISRWHLPEVLIIRWKYKKCKKIVTVTFLGGQNL